MLLDGACKRQAGGVCESVLVDVGQTFLSAKKSMAGRNACPT
jgi:hypothetical protein